MIKNVILQKIIKFFQTFYFRIPISRAFGLDISDYSIEVISLGGSVEDPRLLALGRVILEPGIVENGKIIKKEELTNSLKNLIKNPKFGKLKTRKLIFSIPESRTFIHIFELPKDLKRKDGLEFIKSQASQAFPFLLQELYFDFIISKIDHFKEVLLVASPKNIVNDYLEVFKSLKLKPIALDIESGSLARSLIDKIDYNPPATHAPSQKPVLIADIGARTTNFSIFDKKGLRLSISNETAGNKFTQSLTEGLKISKAEAERIKKEIGLNPETEEGRIFLILQRDIQVGMIWEIRKIEKYFQEKEGKEIKKIILAGGSSLLPRLREYLTENLEKEVAIGDPWVKINIDILKKEEYFKKALEVSPILYSTVIGSALRGLTKNPKEAGINLIKGRK